MVYKLGVVGLGHWFEMMHIGMVSDEIPDTTMKLPNAINV